ncbi:hypothetical protein Naga_102042g2 [Nannochloropsis gaditana]|uniref:Uncharacterized protein n=1 Tax=Nannochloropsis gaditana TaxID=72520 RepID=W7TZW4_9STRA|nr:hypothetical protein Naga_102042g2 [Nannochloropsis gaditana]
MGEVVLYTDSQGRRAKTVIKHVHTDDHPPYYTITLPNGSERQTDFHHIAKLPGTQAPSFPPSLPPSLPPSQPPVGGALGQRDLVHFHAGSRLRIAAAAAAIDASPPLVPARAHESLPISSCPSSLPPSRPPGNLEWKSVRLVLRRPGSGRGRPGMNSRGGRKTIKKRN